MKRAFLGLGLVGSLVVSLPGTAAAADDWREVRLPFLWSTNRLSDLAVAAPDSVWIAGHQGQFCIPGLEPWSCVVRSDGNAVVRRWNGSRWLEYPLNGVPAGSGPMTTVEASGSEVWISDPNGYLGRFDGTAFQKVATPAGVNPAALSVNPAGVWVKQGANDLYRWNGSGWTATPPPPGFTGFTGLVRAATAGEAWGTTRRDGAYHLVRWDGSRWHAESAFPSFSDRDTVDELQVTPSGEVWTIIELPAGEPESTRIHRYRDGSWTDMSPEGGGLHFFLTIDGRGAVWSRGFELFRFDGTTWQRQAMPQSVDVVLDDMTGIPGADGFWSISTRSPAQVFTDS